MRDPVSEFYEKNFKQYAFNEKEARNESHEEIIFVIGSLLTKKWIFQHSEINKRKFNLELQSTLLRFSKKSFEKLFKDKYVVETIRTLFKSGVIDLTIKAYPHLSCSEKSYLETCKEMVDFDK